MSTQKRKTILNNPLARPVKSKSAPPKPATSKKAAGLPVKKSKDASVKKQVSKTSRPTQKKMGAAEILSAGIETPDLPRRVSKPSGRQAAAARAEEILERESKVGSEMVLSIKSVTLASTRAAKIVKLWSWLTVPASFIPVPFVDSATLVGLQIKMISELCKCYGIPFKRESVNAIISGLLGGTMTATVASGLRRGVLKHVPHVGYLASAVTEPILNFSSTYAIGTIFIQHFEKDGDLNNFNFDHVKGSFASYMEKGKLIFKFKSTKKHGEI